MSDIESIHALAEEIKNHCSDLVKVTVNELKDFPATSGALNQLMFVGFDLSLTSTGVAFLTKQGGGVGIVSANITPKKSLKEGERLLYYASVFDKIAFVTRPNFNNKAPTIAVEGYAMGIRGGRSFSIGELGGIFKYVMLANKLPITVVTPHSLKKFIIGGSGSKEKSLMIKKLYTNYYGLDIDNDDQADAAGLALLAFLVHNHEQGLSLCRRLPLKQYQQECLKAEKGIYRL